MYSPVLTLYNTGAAPILPTDFFGKVQLTTKDPWKILTINSGPQTGAPSFTWRKVSDTTFEADPVLINPGDQISNVIYMTSTKPQDDVFPSPPLTWNMRVVNLDQIEYAGATPPKAPFIPQLINVSVFYVGNSVLLLLALFAIYLGVYVYYLFTMGRSSSPLITTFFVVAIGLWSIVAADTGETYLTLPFSGINHLLNAPILVINFIALWWTAFWIYKKAKNVGIWAPAGPRVAQVELLGGFGVSRGLKARRSADERLFRRILPRVRYSPWSGTARACNTHPPFSAKHPII